MLWNWNSNTTVVVWFSNMNLPKTYHPFYAKWKGIAKKGATLLNTWSSQVNLSWCITTTHQIIFAHLLYDSNLLFGQIFLLSRGLFPPLHLLYVFLLRFFVWVHTTDILSKPLFFPCRLFAYLSSLLWFFLILSATEVCKWQWMYRVTNEMHGIFSAAFLSGIFKIFVWLCLWCAWRSIAIQMSGIQSIHINSE